jgi:RNA polymerase sigma-70 factor (sigma-E family)
LSDAKYAVSDLADTSLKESGRQPSAQPGVYAIETAKSAVYWSALDGGSMATAMARQRWSFARTDLAEAPSDADASVERLFRAHRLSMVRLALLLVDDRESAEDVVQEAFAGLHRRWAALRTDEAALGYLRTSVVNGSRSMLRRRRTVRRNPQPAADALTVEPADGRILLAEQHREVLAALRQLPERQREVIVLRYWSELPEAQIAAALGISLGAVKSSASRGRDAIAAMLGGMQ